MLKLVLSLGLGFSTLGQAGEFDSFGAYEGNRSGKSVSLNTHDLDYSIPGFYLHSYFEPSEHERHTVPGADAFMFTLNLLPDEYLRIFESQLSIDNLSIGPDHFASPDDVYRMNFASALETESGQRVVTIDTVIGDYGQETRRYKTSYTLEDGKFVYIQHSKLRKKVFGGWKKVFFAESDLVRKDKGLELRGYGKITEPDSIRSAAKDSSPENFRKLVGK